MSRTGNKLNALKNRSAERARIADLVRQALPARLAEAVSGAELRDGRLTVGVVGAVWASRVRYCADVLRTELSSATGGPVETVRVRVVPSP